jgi:hypothetical protein
LNNPPSQALPSAGGGGGGGDPTMDFLAREQELLGDDAALFGNTLGTPSSFVPPSHGTLPVTVHSVLTKDQALSSLTH